jgi:hypothetical protein
LNFNRIGDVLEETENYYAMYIPFEQLPPYSRVWIYQADHAFSERDEKMIADGLGEFCSQWMVHGHPLQTSFRIDYHQFVILAVDENEAQASGCSIDGSVRVMKELGSKLKIDFFNRLKIGVLEEGSIKTYSKQEVELNYRAGQLSGQSITFNNLLATKAELEKNWQIPLGSSWLAKYLSKDALSV